MDQTLKYTLQSDSKNISKYVIFFFSQFYAKVSDYQVVGLSIGSWMERGFMKFKISHLLTLQMLRTE